MIQMGTIFMILMSAFIFITSTSGTVGDIRWLLLHSGGRWSASESNCMAVCVTEFHEEFEKRTNATSGLQLAYNDPHKFFSKFESRFLDDLCHLYSKAIFCTQSCPEEETHDWIRKVFAVLEYICQEKFNDFLTALPCISMVASEIVESCEPQCGLHQPALKLIHEERMLSKKDSWRLQRLLRSACLHMSCLLACQRPVLFSLCGEDAFNLVDTATRKAFMTTLDVLIYPNNTLLIPNECRMFRNGTEKTLKEEHAPSLASTSKQSSIHTLVLGAVLLVTSQGLLLHVLYGEDGHIV